MYQRIVVALDGSDLAEQALTEARELSRLTGAPLHLIRVADVTRFRFGASEAALAYAALGEELGQEAREARAYLDALAARLGQGDAVTSEVRTGFAAAELQEATNPGDLLVMASHGRGGVARWLLGSVAEEVTRHAQVPVLLVRGDTQQEQTHDA